MAIKSGFFNSVNGDRKYDAKRFAEYFSSFIGNGVFPNPSDSLQVISNDDMTVTVRAGKAWINGFILINDNDYVLELTPADGVLNRVDRIVLRYDVAGREIRLEVKQGDFATDAVAIDLQRDADAYELALADIQVSKGIINITQANITDLRLNDTLCGRVNSLIAGDINSLEADLDKHKAKIATEDTAGHIKLSELNASDIGAVPTSRIITAGTGLSGGGNLSSDRSINVRFGTTSTTVAKGNHTHSEYANMASGTYTGNGNSTRLISVGFSPKAVILMDKYGRAGYYTHTYEVYGGLAVIGGDVIDDDGTQLKLTSSGFYVYRHGAGAQTNKSGSDYRYLALG